MPIPDAEPAPPRRRSERPATGDVLGGKFRIDETLGEGGMGLVYGATNLRTDKRVALKWMLPELVQDERAVTRLMREARAIGRIHHQNIVDIYDVAEHEGTPFLVMERLQGSTLADVISTEPLNPALVVDLLMPALRGIAAAHEQQIIHRDLKPDNIFLCRDAAGDIVDVKVLDFGISKLGREADHSLTKTGAVMGTPQFMSPEQVRGSKHLDARTDIYSVGVILFEALTGRLPHEAEILTALAVAISTEDAPSLRTHVPTLDSALDAIVLKALARDPDERFPTIAELAVELQVFGSGARFREVRTSLVESLAPRAVARASATAATMALGGGDLVDDVQATTQEIAVGTASSARFEEDATGAEAGHEDESSPSVEPETAALEPAEPAAVVRTAESSETQSKTPYVLPERRLPLGWAVGGGLALVALIGLAFLAFLATDGPESPAPDLQPAAATSAAGDEAAGNEAEPPRGDVEVESTPAAEAPADPSPEEPADLVTGADPPSEEQLAEERPATRRRRRRTRRTEPSAEVTAPPPREAAPSHEATGVRTGRISVDDF